MEKKEELEKTIQDRQKEILNDDDDLTRIYEESQTGPQEEPIVFEYQMDYYMWIKYLREKEKKERE